MAEPELIQRVSIDGRQYRAVKEGLAQILAPYREKTSVLTEKSPSTDEPVQQKNQQQKKKFHNNDQGDQAVFYNPIQQYNRDLSVLAILTYGEGAIAEKKSRRAKSTRGGRGRAKKAALKPETFSEEVNGKKRKSEDLTASQANADLEVSAKKLKVSDGDRYEELTVETNTDPTNATEQPFSAEPPAGVTRAQRENKIRFTILDALSASGLRAIRYAKEIPFATNIVANDLLPEAVKSIELNIDHNRVRDKVHSNVGDARAYMYSKVGNESQLPSDTYVHKFDVIDLDPYGTAAPFLDAALLAMVDGGMLCVTCTDAGVFASNGYPEKAYALYGGVTMKGSFSHEAGLRLILHAVATSAAKYGIAIEPLLSLSIDFYARLFIRVHKKQSEVKLLAGTSMVAYSCDNGCGAWSTQLLARNQSKIDKAGNEFFKHSYAQAPTASAYCEHCGYKTHLGGPMWAGPLHNPHFVRRLLNKIPELDPLVYGTTDRLKGMLTLALEEDFSAIVAPNNVESPLDAKSDAARPPQADTTAAVDPSVIPRLAPQSLDKTPFFFIPSDISRVFHCHTPPVEAIKAAIRALGYSVTSSHCKPGSIKTDVPWTIIWEIMREWVRQKSPIGDGTLKEGTAGWRLMNKARGTDRQLVGEVLEGIKLDAGKDNDKEQLRRCLESALYRLQRGISAEAPIETSVAEPVSDASNHAQASPRSQQTLNPGKLDINFDVSISKSERRRDRLVRYQENPRANWGPMSRAGGH